MRNDFLINVLNRENSLFPMTMRIPAAARLAWSSFSLSISVLLLPVISQLTSFTTSFFANFWLPICLICAGLLQRFVYTLNSKRGFPYQVSNRQNQKCNLELVFYAGCMASSFHWKCFLDWHLLVMVCVQKSQTIWLLHGLFIIFPFLGVHDYRLYQTENTEVRLVLVKS